MGPALPASPHWSGQRPPPISSKLPAATPGPDAGAQNRAQSWHSAPSVHGSSMKGGPKHCTVRTVKFTSSSKLVAGAAKPGTCRTSTGRVPAGKQLQLVSHTHATGRKANQRLARMRFQRLPGQLAESPGAALGTIKNPAARLGLSKRFNIAAQHPPGTGSRSPAQRNLPPPGSRCRPALTNSPINMAAV